MYYSSTIVWMIHPYRAFHAVWLCSCNRIVSAQHIDREAVCLAPLPRQANLKALLHTSILNYYELYITLYVSLVLADFGMPLRFTKQVAWGALPVGQNSFVHRQIRQFINMFSKAKLFNKFVPVFQVCT